MNFLDENGLVRLWTHILSKFEKIIKKEDIAAEVTETEENPVSGAAVYDYVSENSGATNLVNGNATGSLRGIGAKAEDSNYVMGQYAFAIGQSAYASGTGSYSAGYVTQASGYYSSAEGYRSKASNSYSKAKGYSTTASGVGSSAEGNTTKAVGDYSHAEGYHSQANGKYSHAEGSYVNAFGTGSHAEGYSTLAVGEYSHAEGYDTSANGDNSRAEGVGTIANTFAESVSGTYNLIVDQALYNIVRTSKVESMSSSTAVYIHTNEPTLNQTTGSFNIEETTQSNFSSLQVGDFYSYNISPGLESYYIVQSTPYYDTSTSQYKASITVCSIESSTTSKGQYVNVIGNGESSTSRSNAHTLDWDGNAWFSGDVYTGSTSGTNKDEGSKKLATEDFVNTKITYGTTDLTAGTSELATGTVYLVYE